VLAGISLHLLLLLTLLFEHLIPAERAFRALLSASALPAKSRKILHLFIVLPSKKS
jgi:hypothetical protein